MFCISILTSYSANVDCSPSQPSSVPRSSPSLVPSPAPSLWYVQTTRSACSHTNLYSPQLLSTPPYFIAFVVTLLSALYSDRVANRGRLIVGWMTVVVIGYAIQLGVDSRKHPGVRTCTLWLSRFDSLIRLLVQVSYFALYLCVIGVAPCISTTISWCGTNIGPSYRRATATGMMFTTGNSGGIVSSLVYLSVARVHFPTISL